MSAAYLFLSFFLFSGVSGYLKVYYTRQINRGGLQKCGKKGKREKRIIMPYLGFHQKGIHHIPNPFHLCRLIQASELW